MSAKKKNKELSSIDIMEMKDSLKTEFAEVQNAQKIEYN